MQVQNLFQPFEIEVMQGKTSCPIQPHRHTFFELVYIPQGEGIYHINDNNFPYRADNLFLMKPMDVNYCTVHTPTSFLFIRFNNIYLNGQQPKDNHNGLGDWIKKLEYIFHNTTHGYGCIVRNRPDKPLVRALTEALIQEQLNRQSWHSDVTQHLINTLITIVARNISMFTAEQTRVEANTSLEIIHYIHQHIYEPEKLKAENIASHFNISINYISEYFKKHTQETLQQYVINYKILLAETRLRHSNLRVNEIAAELGFADESHLTKTFKKRKGVSPAVFRKSLTAIEA
jgi:AraC-like DNA-binding protein